MPIKEERRIFRPIGNISNPDAHYHHARRYFRWLEERNYSSQTVRIRTAYLSYFIKWCDDRGIIKPHDVTKPIIEKYQRYLFLYRKQNGEPLSVRSQHGRLIPVRAWFKWLAKHNYLLYNPASEIELPRLEKRLPKHILSIEEVEQVLNQPDINDGLGIRDRAILEVLYSTGIRRMEVVNLNVFDVDKDRGTLMVRQGKGKKDRMIPIGKRALLWIDKYLNEVRENYMFGKDEGILFLTNLGESFTPNRMTQLVREYINQSGIEKKGSCHLFRHTMATLMLEHGADIRYIQAMLGHAKLDTTQIYTQVSIRQLKDVHTLTHPGSQLKKTSNKEEADAVELSSSPQTE